LCFVVPGVARRSLSSLC